MNDNESSKTEWRLTQLEANYASMSKDVAQIKEMVARWDARFGNTVYLNCPVHAANMENFKSRLEVVEKEQKSYNRFTYKVIGGAIVVLFLVQSFIIPWLQSLFHIKP